VGRSIPTTDLTLGLSSGSAEARRLLDWLRQNGAIEPHLHEALGKILERMFRAIPDVPTVLSHTDAGTHNTVWDGTHAVPIDFEFAAMASADLDLEHVFRTLASQGEPNPASVLLEQASDLLARPGAQDRVWGYAVLRDLRLLRGWLRYTRAGGDLQKWGADTADLRIWTPWLHLQAHATRTSWLAEVLPD
jgi:thiamine kinase-like enzyme